jgi:hypothetical protein
MINTMLIFKNFKWTKNSIILKKGGKNFLNKISLSIFFVWLIFIASPVKSQDTRAKFIGLEAGINFIDSYLPDRDYIRADQSLYGEGNKSANLNSTMNMSYGGIKTEIQTLNKKFGFFTGIRFTYVYSSLGKKSYWDGNPDYFFMLFQQEGTTTEYLKIKEINQNSFYMGVPVEVRFFPFHQKNFRIFFKTGADINYLLSSKTDVVFYDDAMELYEGPVTKITGSPKSFTSNLYFSAGIKIGKETKPGINIEVCAPSFNLTSNAYNLLTTEVGGGLQLNIQLPF